MFSSNLSDLMLGAHDIREEESASFPFHLECNAQLRLPENSVTVVSYIHLQNYIPFYFSSSCSEVLLQSL